MPHQHYIHTTSGRAHEPSILDTHPHIQLSRAGRIGHFRQSSHSSSPRNSTSADFGRHFASSSPDWRAGGSRSKARSERNLVQPGDIFWLRVGLSEPILHTVEALLEHPSDGPEVGGAASSRATSILHRDIAKLHMLEAGRDCMKLRPGIVLGIRYPGEDEEESTGDEPMVEIMPFGTVDGTPRPDWDELFAFFAVSVESEADLLRPLQRAFTCQASFNWHASADGAELEWEDGPKRWTSSQGKQPWEQRENHLQRIKKVDEEYVIRFNQPWSGPIGAVDNNRQKTLSSWAAGQSVWVPFSSLVPPHQRDSGDTSQKATMKGRARWEDGDRRKGKRRFNEETSERYTGTLADILSVGTEQTMRSKASTPVRSGAGTPAPTHSVTGSSASCKSTSSSTTPSPRLAPSAPVSSPPASPASSMYATSKVAQQPRRVLHTHLPATSVASLRALVSARRDAYANLSPAQRDRLLQSYAQGRFRRSEWEFGIGEERAPRWREHDAYWETLGGAENNQPECRPWTAEEITAGFREIKREASDWVEYEHWMADEQQLEKQRQHQLERGMEQRRQPTAVREREREREIVWGGLDVLQVRFVHLF